MNWSFGAAFLTLAIFATPSLLSTATRQERYTAERSGDIVRLEDRATQTAVSVVAPMSNAYEMVVKGHDVIRKTFTTVADFRAQPGLNGMPLLAPFAGRLDQTAFYANGRKYNFDLELGNVRGPIPIHGFLRGATDWKLVEARADASGAWVANRLDFYRNPQYMKQFPFAHTLTMTYRLENGVLEVRTRIDNLSNEPMPVSLGFHPLFRLTDSTRDDWTVSVGAKTRWSEEVVEPIEKSLPNPRAVRLRELHPSSNAFSELERDAQGRGVVSVKGRTQQLDVLLGPSYRCVVLWSPDPTSDFIALEPWVAIPYALNLAHKGLYKELQSVPPGGMWQESFWIRPSGF